MESEKLKPYYYQRGEDYEEEFIGFAKNWDEAVDMLGSEHIHEMSVVDVIDQDMFESIKKFGCDESNGFDEQVMKELEEYFANEKKGE